MKINDSAPPPHSKICYFGGPQHGLIQDRAASSRCIRFRNGSAMEYYFFEAISGQAAIFRHRQGAQTAAKN